METPLGGEQSVTQLHWLDLNSKNVELSQFEYWSQLCLRVFFRSFVRGQPTFVIARSKPLKPPHVLCIAGEIGSGKSEATEVLRNECGYTEINSGRVLAGLMRLPPVPQTSRQRFQEAAWKFISQVGAPERLAKAIWKTVQQADSRKVLVDGIRQRVTLLALKRLAAPTRVGLLYVYTPPDLAYAFYASRDRRPTIKIYDFLRIRDASVEADVKRLIRDADAVVYNWTGRIQYQAVIRALMRTREEHKALIEG